MENIKPKKIVLLVTYDHGGAAEYIYKLSNILKNQGHQIAMVVKEKTKADDFIVPFKNKQRPKHSIFFKIIQKLNKKKYKIRLDEKYHFYAKEESSVNLSPQKFFDKVGFVPDVIFAGWTSGFINSSEILLLQQFSKAKVYTITVDMNHFTGGCHYAWDCNGYIEGCSTCPAILNSHFKDLAKTNFEIKFNNAQQGNFEIIAGSGWTLHQARQSKIYKNQKNIININSLIDTSVMKPSGKNEAKDVFNLEHDQFYILMGCQNANELRKGFRYLLESLEILHKELSIEARDKINVIIVSSKPVQIQDEIPFKITQLDYIKDYNKLSLLYQAVDVFVNSSVEDSGPMMVSEAMACGTPVVGFDMGVVHNLVITGVNGYKATLMDSEDLARGIKTIFSLSPEEYNIYSKNAVDQIQENSSLEYGASLMKTLLNE
ncbi:glycosyltransferase [Flavobacterium sp.]|uniref:glycosyltransferase n=1 Tax=Flavobacterium sp. TaxID=239 RepID=UPI00286B6C1F|nr:glycosyltransferase [Flavobacterium sp.]